MTLSGSFLHPSQKTIPLYGMMSFPGVILRVTIFMDPLQLYQENPAKESRAFLLLLLDFLDCRPFTLRLHLKEKVQGAVLFQSSELVRRAKRGKLRC